MKGEKSREGLGGKAQIHAVEKHPGQSFREKVSDCEDWLQKFLLKMGLLMKQIISDSSKQRAQGLLEITMCMPAVLHRKYLI